MHPLSLSHASHLRIPNLNHIALVRLLSHGVRGAPICDVSTNECACQQSSILA